MRAELQLNEAPRPRVAHPRDRWLTIYGRQPVLEVLADDDLEVVKVLLATSATGPQVDAIVTAARRRSVPVKRVPAVQVTRISRNGRQDQGVVADVAAPRMAALDEATPDGAVLLLDGITTPANVGMILRSAVAAGISGIVLPRAGMPEVGPLVIKASAGVAFRAPILRCGTPVDGAAYLAAAGFRLYGLAASAERTLFDGAGFPARSAFVIGSEHAGVSTPVRELVHEWLAIPMAGGVDSLNVAVAAGVVCFELARLGLTTTPAG